MSILSENLRYLRARQKLSQRGLAEKLILSRGRYSKYEDAISEPPLDVLQRMSHYFYISIDLLISVDLRSLPLDILMGLPDNRILLPVSRTLKSIEIVSTQIKSAEADK